VITTVGFCRLFSSSARALGLTEPTAGAGGAATARTATLGRGAELRLAAAAATAARSGASCAARRAAAVGAATPAAAAWRVAEATGAICKKVECGSCELLGLRRPIDWGVRHVVC
jgi:hypothetical protein